MPLHFAGWCDEDTLASNAFGSGVSVLISLVSEGLLFDAFFGKVPWTIEKDLNDMTTP